MAGVRFRDNTDAVESQLERNVKRTLPAMGREAVGLIMDGMDTLYGAPIWQTGDLHRDVNYKVREADKSVDVGNSLEYAPFVHEGTRKMKARPYITDSLNGDYAKERLLKIAEAGMKTGF